MCVCVCVRVWGHSKRPSLCVWGHFKRPSLCVCVCGGTQSVLPRGGTITMRQCLIVMPEETQPHG